LGSKCSVRKAPDLPHGEVSGFSAEGFKESAW
jgi:hypothetical protein